MKKDFRPKLPNTPQNLGPVQPELPWRLQRSKTHPYPWHIRLLQVSNRVRPCDPHECCTKQTQLHRRTQTPHR